MGRHKIFTGLIGLALALGPVSAMAQGGGVVGSLLGGMTAKPVPAPDPTGPQTGGESPAAAVIAAPAGATYSWGGASIPLTPIETLKPFAKGCRFFDTRVGDFSTTEWLGACRFGLAHGNGLIRQPNGGVYATAFSYGHNMLTERDIADATQYWFWGNGASDRNIYAKYKPLTGDQMAQVVYIDRQYPLIFYKKTVSNNVMVIDRILFAQGACVTVEASKKLFDIAVSPKDMAIINKKCADGRRKYPKPGFFYIIELHFIDDLVAGKWVVRPPGGTMKLTFCDVNDEIRACRATWDQVLVPYVADYQAMRAGQPAEIATLKRELAARFAPLEAVAHQRVLATTRALAASYVPRRPPALAAPPRPVAAAPARPAATKGKRK